jgi:hypothetical protein
MVDARTPPALFARRFPACIFSRAGAGRRAPAGHALPLRSPALRQWVRRAFGPAGAGRSSKSNLRLLDAGMEDRDSLHLRRLQPSFGTGEGLISQGP